jgi:chromosomal replication initiation ATPase DnaA
VGAAERILRGERPDYSPLYLHARGEERARRFLEAVGRTHLARRPEGRVGFTSVKEFSQDFIRAISAGVAGAWRERWWSVDILLLHGVEDLSATERAQEEFFHLFEALTRRSAWIFLASDRPPTRISKVEERLRSRFEGGLVVDLGKGEAPSAPAPAEAADDVRAASASPAAREPAAREPATPWFPSPEKVVWNWPIPEERIAGGEE